MYNSLASIGKSAVEVYNVSLPFSGLTSVSVQLDNNHFSPRWTREVNNRLLRDSKVVPG